jgi:hypothetical protein
MTFTANAENTQESNHMESEYAESLDVKSIQESEYAENEDAESKQESEYAESEADESQQENADAESKETREFDVYDVLVNSTYSEDEVFGDTNGDGNVDTIDAYNILLIYAQMSAGILPHTYVKNWDADYDGEIAISDACVILSHYAKQAAGLDDPWPPKKDSVVTTEPVETTTEIVETTTSETTTVEMTTQSTETTVTTVIVQTTEQSRTTTTETVGATTTTETIRTTTTESVQTTGTTTTTKPVETTTTTTFVGNYKVGDVIMFTGEHWNIREAPSLQANVAEVGLETNYMFKLIYMVDQNWAYGISINPDKDLTQSEIGFVKVDGVNFKLVEHAGSLQIGDVLKFKGESWNLRSTLDELSGEHLYSGDKIVVIDFIIYQNGYEWYWGMKDGKKYIFGYTPSVFYKSSNNFANEIS